MDSVHFTTGHETNDHLLFTPLLIHNANTESIYITPPPIVRQWGYSHNYVTSPPPLVRSYAYSYSYTDLTSPPIVCSLLSYY